MTEYIAERVKEAEGRPQDYSSTGLWSGLGEIWARRELLLVLAGRELRVRYKQSLLGVAWAIIQPLSLTLVFTVVFGYFAGVASGGAPKPLFYYAAMTPWTFCAAAIGFSVGSLVANSSLLTKIRFPRELLIFAAIAACGVDFLIALSLLPVLMLIFHCPITLQALWLPVLILIEVLLIAGLSLFVAAANVYYRDLRFLVALGLNLWLFASPVAISVGTVPARFQKLFMLNPMAPILEGFRSTLLHGQSPDMVGLAQTALISAAIFILGYWAFKRLEPGFADVI